MRPMFEFESKPIRNHTAACLNFASGLQLTHDVVADCDHAIFVFDDWIRSNVCLLASILVRS